MQKGNPHFFSSRLIWIFALSLTLFVSACEEQEKLSIEQQEQYYNKAYGSVFLGLNEISDKEATDLFRKAAESGHAPSQWHLGRLYDQGDGIEKDLNRAVFWKERAADQGYLSAELDMAEAYMLGEGVVADTKKAFNFLMNASEKEHPRAFLLLSAFYIYGVEVDVDATKARQYVDKSKELYKHYSKNVPLENSKGESLGRVAPEQARQIFEKFAKLIQAADEKLASDGNVEAQYNRGIYYAKLSKFEESFLWTWAAAKAGYVNAQGFIGRFLKYPIHPLSEEEKIYIYVACSLAEKAFSEDDGQIEYAQSKLVEARECISISEKNLDEEALLSAEKRINNPEFFVYKRINGNFEIK